MAGGVSTPVIISVTIGAVLVLSVAIVTIVRWARTKPSTQLPPPRPASLSPYWANQQRYSFHPSRPDVYDEERKLTGQGSGIFRPFGEYDASNASDSSLYRGTKTPYTDGDHTPNSGASFGHENGGTQSEHHTPRVQPNELGEISLNGPNPPRHRPTSIQFVPGTAMMRPPGSFGSLPPNGSSFATAGGDAQQAAATDPSSTSQHNQSAPPSAFSHHPSPPRPFSTSSRSRHSIAGPPVAPQQPPPSFNNSYQTKQDRRASRMSMYSTYSTHTFSYPDPRRSSVNSMNMIRGPPHKSNMQIILPQPLAPTAAPAAGHGLPGNSIPAAYSANDADDNAFRRNQRRHSRVDMWTETNNIARSKSPSVPLAELADGSRRNRRPSQGSDRSASRSLELPNSGQFVHMQPPPPLPAASSRSFLTSSRSATPTSSSSALPPMSSAVTTPATGSSAELGLEKPANSSSSTLNNANDDAKTPQPQNAALKSDNLQTIPSAPLIEPQ